MRNFHTFVRLFRYLKHTKKKIHPFMKKWSKNSHDVEKYNIINVSQLLSNTSKRILLWCFPEQKLFAKFKVCTVNCDLRRFPELNQFRTNR